MREPRSMAFWFEKMYVQFCLGRKWWTDWAALLEKILFLARSFGVRVISRLPARFFTDPNEKDVFQMSSGKTEDRVSEASRS